MRAKAGSCIGPRQNTGQEDTGVGRKGPQGGDGAKVRKKKENGVKGPRPEEKK